MILFEHQDAGLYIYKTIKNRRNAFKNNNGGTYDETG
jgi:hypothetical protein